MCQTSTQRCLSPITVYTYLIRNTILGDGVCFPVIVLRKLSPSPPPAGGTVEQPAAVEERPAISYG